MKKIALLLCAAVLFSLCLCACRNEPEDYSEGDGNSEFISMENKKVSTDDIEFNVVSADSLSEPSVIKTYKTEFLPEDFTVKFQKVKVSDCVYVAEEDRLPVYPEKTVLPEYDTAALYQILAAKYFEKYGEAIDGADVFVTAPKFSTRNFTGKLLITYLIYSSPDTDELGVACYKAAKRVTLTCDLYDFKVEE